MGLVHTACVSGGACEGVAHRSWAVRTVILEAHRMVDFEWNGEDIRVQRLCDHMDGFIMKSIHMKFVWKCFCKIMSIAHRS